MKFIYDHYLEIFLSTGALAYAFSRFYEAYCELRARAFEDKVAKKMKKDFKKIEKELRQYGTSDWNDDPSLIVDTPKNHIRLDRTICLSCRRSNDHVPPIKAEFMSKEYTQGVGEIHIFSLDKNIVCEHCGFMYSTVEGVVNKDTRKKESSMDKKTIAQATKEIIEDYNKEAGRTEIAFKLLMFGTIWFAAGLSIYGLSFVPWLPILASFWILTKNLTYALTRWYSLAGLSVTFFIFYQWHKQAIRDKIDYLRNIRNTRKRYRNMIEKKEEVTEEEVRSFVNEANCRDKQTVKPDVIEDEIPF